MVMIQHHYEGSHSKDILLDHSCHINSFVPIEILASNVVSMEWIGVRKSYLNQLQCLFEINATIVTSQWDHFRNDN